VLATKVLPEPFISPTGRARHRDHAGFATQSPRKAGQGACNESAARTVHLPDRAREAPRSCRVRYSILPAKRDKVLATKVLLEPLTYPAGRARHQIMPDRYSILPANRDKVLSLEGAARSINRSRHGAQAPNSYQVHDLTISRNSRFRIRPGKLQGALPGFLRLSRLLSRPSQPAYRPAE
jgi:hypothetical protein